MCDRFQENHQVVLRGGNRIGCFQDQHPHKGRHYISNNVDEDRKMQLFVLLCSVLTLPYFILTFH